MDLEAIGTSTTSLRAKYVKRTYVSIRKKSNGNTVLMTRNVRTAAVKKKGKVKKVCYCQGAINVGMVMSSIMT